jgi:hypothetical protein
MRTRISSTAVLVDMVRIVNAGGGGIRSDFSAGAWQSTCAWYVRSCGSVERTSANGLNVRFDGIGINWASDPEPKTRPVTSQLVQLTPAAEATSQAKACAMPFSNKDAGLTPFTRRPSSAVPPTVRGVDVGEGERAMPEGDTEGLAAAIGRTGRNQSVAYSSV